MSTLSAPQAPPPSTSIQTQADDSETVSFQRYYAEAGPDYESWSKRYNMHFGYWRQGMNPFRLEPMLEQMNREVLGKLRVHEQAAPRILDMGCGLGATLRSIGRQVPAAQLTGITLVPWQVERGSELNREAGAEAIALRLNDYERTDFAAESFDAAYALESSCYAHGANKAAFLKEAHRLLRPGARLVMADGFLTRRSALNPLQRAIYRKLCECWVIDTLGEIGPCVREMERLGFGEITARPIQAQVAPSVFHVPVATLRFLFGTVLPGKRKMTRARWNNIIAPVLLPFVGYPLGPMRYYMISATRL